MKKNKLNYLTEINAFNRWLEHNYLPTVTQLLWYKLIHLCNKSGWGEWVSVKNIQLMALLDLSLNSEKTFTRYRDLLIENKLIQYKKGKKGSPSQYKLNSVIALLSKEDSKYIAEIPQAVEEKPVDKSKKDIKPKEETKGNPDVELIINYLNKKTNKNFKADTEKTISLITSLFKKGYTVDDIKKVIDIKVSDWLNTEWDKYLRPQTLFRITNFENYINEKSDIKTKPKNSFNNFKQLSDDYPEDYLEELAKKKRDKLYNSLKDKE